MKKPSKIMLAAVLSATLLTQTSCIGSFSLTNKVYDFNKTVGDKFINEVVFLAFFIVPIYEISFFIDGIILNTVEFWTGSNPLAMKEGDKAEDIVSVKGIDYKMTAEKNKMSIEVLNGETAGKQLEIVYNDTDGMWTMNTQDQSINLMQYNENEQSAIVFMPNGTQYKVSAEENNFEAVASQIEMHSQSVAIQ